MRFLGIGDCIELSGIYLPLMRDGHEVRVYAGDPRYAGTLAGLIEPVADWRAQLDWVGRDGVILFETVGQGALQDALRRDGYAVVGGSAFGDRLENDRAFGQDFLRDLGLAVAPSRVFATPAEAAAWLRANPGPAVIKYDKSAFPTFVGEHPRGEDTLFRLERAPAGSVLLMEALEGVEVGVGAYFNGERFLKPVALDFEHKRFFPGDLGEMTGEMGTLASFEGAERLFAATLAKTEAAFHEAGHVGWVNLNLIANERGLWPLEFTCRFGYPGYVVLGALKPRGWADLLTRLRTQDSEEFAALPGWSVAIVVTIPPFPHGPNETAVADDDPPIFFHREPDGEELRHYSLIDVRRVDGRLFARRQTGYVMVVTGTGETVEAAQAAARSRARNVILPEARWREDIGARFLERDRARLRRLGWL